MSKSNIDNFLKHATEPVCIHILETQMAPIDLKLSMDKLQTIIEPQSTISETTIKLQYKNDIVQSKIVGKTISTFVEQIKSIKVGSYMVSHTKRNPFTGNVPDHATKIDIMRKFYLKLINTDGTLCVSLKKTLTNPLEFSKKIKSSVEDLASDFTNMIDTAYDIIEIYFIVDTITKQSVYEIASLINTTMNVSSIDENYQIELYELAKDIYRDPITISQFKHKSGFKRLGSSTIELSRPTFFKTVLPNINQYMLTDKMDGLRALLVIEEITSNKKVVGANIRAISDTIYTIQEYKKQPKNTLRTVLDVEMLDDQSFHCFDVIMYKSKRLSGVHFDIRMQYFEDVSKLMKLYSLGQVKEFVKLDKQNFCKQITDFYNKKRDYHIDGLIFTPIGQPFKKLTNRNDRQFNYSYPTTVSLKWKPKEQMTIDFYCMKISDEKYMLCSGVDMNTFKRFGMSFFEGYKAPNTPNANKYFPIQFESYDGTFDNIWKPTKEDMKMLITEDKIYESFDGLVGEFQLSDEKKMLDKPKLLKVRFDRIQDVAKGEYFGNAYRYADLIWHSIKNPLEIKNMCDAKTDSYFASDNNDEYSGQRAFNSYVKTHLIEKYLYSSLNKSSRIMDIMAGKGQDLARVIDIGFTEIIAIDRDIDALYEMLERKYNLRVKRNNAEARVNIKQIDLENIPEDFNITVDCAMINFGIHYLCHDNGLDGLIKMCNKSIKSGGRLLITALDGETVFDLLKETPLWKLTENGKIKYSVQKKYSSKEFLPLNQSIGVLLPFSNGEMYDEYLVNFEYIESVFTDFKLIAYDNFGSIVKSAKKNNKQIYDKLTEADQKWVSMYSYMILEKK